MNCLLVPTDFSETADNAVDYAAELAVTTKARIILLHVYQLSYVSPEAPLYVPVPDEVEGSSMEILNKKASELRTKFGSRLQVDCVFRTGFIVEEIIRLAGECTPDLIIIGMQGAGYLAERLIGSISTSVITKSKYPVLVVNKEVKFKAIKKIVFAYDYVSLKRKEVIDPLKNFANLFRSHIHILEVNPEMVTVTVPNVQEAAAGIRIDHLLEENTHSFHYIENKDVVEGIQHFISERGADMVVMVPHQHSFLNKMFHEPNTKRMAFHTKVPLLTLPE